MDASSKNMYPMIDKAISEPLTDNRTANALKDNTEGLLKAGIEPDISHLRYIKLNRFEQEEKLAEAAFDRFMAELKQNDMSDFHNLVKSLSDVRDVSDKSTLEDTKCK